LKVLDFAVGGVGGDGVAEKLVATGGLKVLFTMFMKKVQFRNARASHVVTGACPLLGRFQG